MAKETEKNLPKEPDSVVATSANDIPAEPKNHVLGDRELKRGDQGEDVKALQTRLGLEPTGHFNEAVERKVNYLLRTRGMKESGKVNREFRNTFRI